MATMIERVARVLAQMEYGEDVDDVWENYVPHARAAIAAMREPTEEMRRAGTEHIADNFDVGVFSTPTSILAAMIDAALEEKP